jgi:hypothetical protein
MQERPLRWPCEVHDGKPQVSELRGDDVAADERMLHLLLLCYMIT